MLKCRGWIFPAARDAGSLSVGGHMILRRRSHDILLDKHFVACHELAVKMYMLHRYNGYICEPNMLGV